MPRGTGARRRRSERRRNGEKLGVQEAQALTVPAGPEDGPAQTSTTLQEQLAYRALARLRAEHDDAIRATDLDWDGAEEFAGSGSATLALGPRNEKWDAAAADQSVRRWAGATDAPNAKYAQAFMVKQGDGTKFGDYKLGFADAGDGEGAGLVANWGGITAVAGVLSGARGGANITDAEAAHAKSLCETYYAKAAKQYDDENIKVPWRASAEAVIAYANEHRLAVITSADGEFMGVHGEDVDSAALEDVGRAAAAEALAYAQVGAENPAALAVATLAWESVLQASGAECSDCGHTFADHLGETGPCTYDDCECGSFATTEPDEDDDEEMTLRAAADGTLAGDLGVLLADVVSFYLAAHGAHWNVVGDDFHQWHELFEMIYEDVYDSIDPLAENMRKLGALAPFRLDQFASDATIQPVADETDPERLAADLLVRNDLLVAKIGVLFDRATAERQQGIANFLAERQDHHQKWSWQLGASLAGEEPERAGMFATRMERAFLRAADAVNRASGHGDDEVEALIDEWLAGAREWSWQLPAALRGGIQTVRAARGRVVNADASSTYGFSVTTNPQTWTNTNINQPVLSSTSVAFTDVEIVPAQPGTGGDVVWSAIFAPEGKLTSDGRAFAPGSITWRDLPLTLSAMTKTADGHDGAQVCGRIDRIWRDEQTGLIRATGVFDSGEFGQEIARLVSEEKLRGVSVDIAASLADVASRSDYFDAEGNWAPRPEAERLERSMLDVVYDQNDPPVTVILAGEIGMTTVCPFPAFADARIAVGESLVAAGVPSVYTVTNQAGWVLTGEPDCGCDPGLTAAAAGIATDAPPAEWFADPALDGPTAITVDDDGRLFGHAALWNVCHIGLPGQCRTAPHSLTGYRHFHLGEVLCSGGERLAVGQVTLDAPHADRQLDAASTVAHYDHTGTAVADVRVGEDEFGIWVAGAVRPDAPEAKVRTLRGAKLSGDWRRISGNLELVGLLCVNVPGFPVPRAAAALAASGGVQEVVSLVAAGIPVFEADLNEDELEQFRMLQAEHELAALADENRG